MALLSIDLSKTPDKQQVLKPGVRRLRISKPPEVGPSKSNPTGDPVVKVEMKVSVNDPIREEHDRPIFDTISVRMDTKLKRLALSAGLERTAIEGGTLDLDLLNDREVLAVVATSPYTDPSTGIARDTNKIADYLIPGDQGYPATP